MLYNNINQFDLFMYLQDYLQIYKLVRREKKTLKNNITPNIHV